MERPRTTHDFGGFLRALYQVEYPAMGSRWLAEATQRVVPSAQVGLDEG
jgi:4,5-DOPA dioxygenase extradiol